METTPSYFNKLRRPVSSLLALGSLSLVGACGVGSTEIAAGKPVLVLDEDESRRFITAQESGGYPHYEPVYRFIVKMCDGDARVTANASECQTLSTNVSESAFNEFGPGDTITFGNNHRGYPVNSK